MRPIITCIECSKRKEHHGKGLCLSCYDRHHQQKLNSTAGRMVLCTDCRSKVKLKRGNVCHHCRYKRSQNKYFTLFERPSPPRIILCIKCNKEKPVHTNAMCHGCYMKQRRANKGGVVIICKECHHPRRHVANGYCSTCYPKHSRNVQECVKCHKVISIKAKGLCLACYSSEVPNIPCKQCNRKLYKRSAQQLCRACTSRSKPPKQCVMCGNQSIWCVRNLCPSCRNKETKLCRKDVINAISQSQM
jgi:hypothetical protein